MAGGSLIPIDHPYIEQHNVAQRFVAGKLRQSEKEAFERHYVDCQECLDRVALAKKKAQVGVFNLLATFTPREQGAIFAASTLALLLMPVAAMKWMDSRGAEGKAEAETVLWLPPKGAVEARIRPSTKWISIATATPEQEGTYRLSIVDVADRPIVTGPDQQSGMGTAMGLRLSTLPSGVTFAIVEKKAENGAYQMLSRHPLLIEWRP